MRNKPLVTVAIPTRNRASYLELTLRSVLSQDHEPFEVLVADNASTDRTPELLDSIDDARVRSFRHAKDVGMAANWNSCLKKARGDWFLLLSDDDLIDPDFLSYCLESMPLGDPPGVIETATRIIDAEGEVIAEALSRGDGLSVADYMIAYFEGRVSQFLCGCLFNTEGLRSIGGFHSPKNLRLDLRVLLLLGAELGRVDLPEAKASYRRHAGRATVLSTVEDWHADDLDIVETAVSLAPPEEAESVRAAGLRWAARWSYERACERLSFGQRVALILRVWRRCGFTNPPWPGAFVSLHSPWGRGLRGLRNRLGRLAGR